MFCVRIVNDIVDVPCSILSTLLMRVWSIMGFVVCHGDLVARVQCQSEAKSEALL